MKSALLAWCAFLLSANDCVAQAGNPSPQQRFEGAGAREAVCAFLLNARHSAEIEGRLDFGAVVESFGGNDSPTLVARISTGPSYAIRQIHFSGHRKINDATLRRTLTTFERQMLNIQDLRRSLAQVDRLGVFEPLALEDVLVTRLDDGVTVDLTIQLRERKPRWWSIAGVLLPGGNPLRASIASRLPAWGRGFFELATYFVSLNTVGFGTPFLALERAIVPGQEWLSGFAITPALSPRSMVTHYARTHALHAVGAMLDSDVGDPFSVDIESATGPAPAPLTCKPPKPRLWWLRGVARQLLAIYG